MTYPPLSTCDPRQDGETLPEYAARVLRFLLATQTTATLTDEQLELADTAACRAAAQLTGPADDPRPSQLDAAGLQTAVVLSAARHSIAAVLRWRRAQATQAPAQDATAPKAGAQPGRPAPLQPAPTQRPPGGATADLRRTQAPAPVEIRF